MMPPRCTVPHTDDARRPRESLLARRINIHQAEHVGIVEGATRNPSNRSRILVYRCGWKTATMRRLNAARAAASVAFTFLRMMRVVVDHDAPGGLALDFEAAADAGKFRERSRRDLES